MYCYGKIENIEIPSGRMGKGNDREREVKDNECSREVWEILFFASGVNL